MFTIMPSGFCMPCSRQLGRGMALTLGLAMLTQTACAVEVIRACGGDAEWVPSSFFRRSSQDIKTEQVVGYSPDVLRAALAGKGYQVEVELLPWMRCLKEVTAGKRYQVVMALIFSPNRAKDYQFTDNYQTFHPGYFYWRSRKPGGVPLASTAALADFKVCGLYGFNYAYSGLPADRIDSGAVNYTSLALKLQVGRCDVGLEMQEVLSGHLQLGEIRIPAKALVWEPLPDSVPVMAAFGVGRRVPQADKLVADLNAGIRRLQANGGLERLLGHYIGTPQH